MGRRHDSSAPRSDSRARWRCLRLHCHTPSLALVACSIWGGHRHGDDAGGDARGAPRGGDGVGSADVADRSGFGAVVPGGGVLEGVQGDRPVRPGSVRRCWPVGSTSPTRGRRPGVQVAATSGGPARAASGWVTRGGRVRRREQLEDLPDTPDALRKGELSADQVEVIADAATANPKAEQDLMESAKQKGLKDLKDDCGRAKQQGDRDPEATRRRIQARATVRDRRPHRRRGGAVRERAGRRGRRRAGGAAADRRPLLPRTPRHPRAGRTAGVLWDALIEVARNGVDGTDPARIAPTTPTPRRRRRRGPTTSRSCASTWRHSSEAGSKATRPARSPASDPSRSHGSREMLPDSSIRLVITKGIDGADCHEPRPGPERRAEDRADVVTTRRAPNIACSHTWTQRRPPRPLRQGPAHRARATSTPSATARPRPQDLPRLGPRRRHRTTSLRRTHRPPPPQHTRREPAPNHPTLHRAIAITGPIPRPTSCSERRGARPPEPVRGAVRRSLHGSTRGFRRVSRHR